MTSGGFVVGSVKLSMNTMVVAKNTVNIMELTNCFEKFLFTQ